VRICTIAGCGKRLRSATYCAMHWNRLQRNGDPLLSKEPRHGGHDLPEYTVWEGMISRCFNPRQQSYVRYGARGITVSVSWRSFANFIADMGRRPSEKHTLERVDNACGYSKENCVWATRQAQQNNMSSNRKVELRGQVVTVAEAARILGIKYSTAHGRVRKGLDLETGERNANRL
jgi:hypothetical protein